jgi:hypothetical protein
MSALCAEWSPRMWADAEGGLVAEVAPGKVGGKKGGGGGGGQQGSHSNASQAGLDNGRKLLLEMLLPGKPGLPPLIDAQPLHCSQAPVHGDWVVAASRVYGPAGWLLPPADGLLSWLGWAA